MPVDSALLSVKGLVYRYKGSQTPAVAGLGFTVDAGEVVGLLGPNGAGKTTTASIVSTLLKPQAGEVTLLGVDALKHPSRARGLIGLAPQEIALYPTLDAFENLSFFGSLQGLYGARLKERMNAVLADVGLLDRAKSQVRTYSGGMKRRLNLAVALLHEPRLVILDEPTVGIDAQSRQLIMDKIRALKAQGAGVIYTTHYMEEAQSLCDRVLVVDAGSIVEEGALPEIFARHPDLCTLEDVFIKLTGKAVRDAC